MIIPPWGATVKPFDDEKRQLNTKDRDVRCEIAKDSAEQRSTARTVPSYEQHAWPSFIPGIPEGRLRRYPTHTAGAPRNASRIDQLRICDMTSSIRIRNKIGLRVMLSKANGFPNSQRK
jgi:hypothetical protein